MNVPHPPDRDPRRRSAPVLAWVALAFLLSPAGHALGEADLRAIWPAPPEAPIGQLGSGVGIVFTPDLSVPGNCAFYEALGFACFDDPDWAEVLRAIRRHNEAGSRQPIHTVVLETHGTNGHGLKLQESKAPAARRSYISVGALQERLGEAGVRHVILSACNSGRLLRPSIYRRLDRTPGDKLFLPPTLGIIDASDRFDPERAAVRVIAPEESHIETTIVAAPAELGASTRHALRAIALDRGVTLPHTFAISDMLMKILVRDATLRLRDASPVSRLSNSMSSPEESERLFKALVSHLETTALRMHAQASSQPLANGTAAN